MKCIYMEKMAILSCIVMVVRKKNVINSIKSRMTTIRKILVRKFWLVIIILWLTSLCLMTVIFKR